MEHNLLPGCILSCKKWLRAITESKSTHLSSTTPCFTDGNHGQRNTAVSAGPQQSRRSRSPIPLLPSSAQLQRLQMSHFPGITHHKASYHTHVHRAPPPASSHTGRTLSSCLVLSSSSAPAQTSAPRCSPSQGTGHLASSPFPTKKTQQTNQGY